MKPDKMTPFLKRIFGIFLLGILFGKLYGQTLPANIRYIEENHMLVRELANNSFFYQVDVIDTIFLEFENDDYWSELTDNYGTSEYVMASFKNSTNSFDSVGIKFKGNTI